MRRWAASSVVILATTAGCGQDRDARGDQPEDRAAVVAALEKWPEDFNTKNLGAVCGLFADDVVLLYPDSPPRNHRQFCSQVQTSFDDPAKQFRYDKPDIHEVLVDGDLATVWLNWKLTVRDGTGALLESVDEDGVDVFRRQPDGSWKIHISHAFPASQAG